MSNTASLIIQQQIEFHIHFSEKNIILKYVEFIMWHDIQIWIQIGTYH